MDRLAKAMQPFLKAIKGKRIAGGQSSLEVVVHTVNDLVAAYAAIARPEIRKDHLVGSCVAATWITIQVMRLFRVRARAITVRVEICNSAFVNFEREFGRRPLLGESADTWIVGVGFEKGQGLVGTHVIALIDEQIIVDASIDQGNAPEHGITLPGVVYTVVEKEFHSGTRMIVDVSGQRLVYIPHNVKIELRSLYDFNHNAETDGAVQRIAAKLEQMGFHPLD